MKKIISVFCCVITLLNTTVFSQNISLRETAEYLKTTVTNPSVGQVGGEWTVIGLVRYEENSEYFDNYYKNVETYVRECNGVLHERKYTEYSRVILALTAIGKNPENVSGYNLLKPLADFNGVVRQGVNGAIWALIALDSKGYKIPENEEAEIKATRKMYVDYILSREMSGGGWALSANKEDPAEPDITGMALIALSNYKDNPEVLNAIERAIAAMSVMQDETGGFESFGEKNCESGAQMIVALSSLGISLDDPRFVKDGNTLLDAVKVFYVGNGGFSHSENEEINIMTTEQVFYALVAAKRYETGQSPLFDMNPKMKFFKTNYVLPAFKELVAKGI